MPRQEGKVEHMGYLKKRSPRTVLGHHIWQTRWFVLKRLQGDSSRRRKPAGAEAQKVLANVDIIIEYYKNKRVYEKGKDPIGNLFCTYLKAVRLHPKGKPGKFQLELDGNYTFFLWAASHDECEEWYSRLRTICKEINHGLSQCHSPASNRITRKKYWKSQHLHLQAQGHKERKRTLSQQLSIDVVGDIMQDGKRPLVSPLKSPLKSPSMRSPMRTPLAVSPIASPAARNASRSETKKGFESCASDMASSGIVSMSSRSPPAARSPGAGTPRKRDRNKLKLRLERAEQARKQQQDLYKKRMEINDAKNKKSLEKLIKAIEMYDNGGLEALAPLFVRSESSRFVRKEKYNQSEYTDSCRGVKIPKDLRLTETKCGEERDAEVAKIKQRLKKLYKLTDFHLEHLDQKIHDLYEFGGVRANVEFVDICRALDKRKWDLVSKIGSGGFGAVYRCRWVGETKKLAFGTPIAVKIIDLENDEGEDISTVNREIDALAEGQLCPQLTRYYDSGISGSELWIAMEFIDGGSVAALVRKKPMKEDEIAFVCKEIIFGLQYLAQHGSKIHRDIKGANILLSKDGRVKIADFGASRTLSKTGFWAGKTFVGSPFWMAPEIVQTRSYDGKVDVWSLGCTCIEMACGKPPNYNLKPNDVIKAILNNPSPKLPGGFSDEFNAFVNSCLRKDPDRRPNLERLLAMEFLQHSIGKKVLVDMFKKRKG
eukprot:CAMPEP_0197530472 /NCGR_PEP_ID=MMETSP1318-20131121/31971_1 /TAXON_ID=552666 /ORGANISM="Partenskyella glossopodia, Strain RCC365" /LENGTH=710 /DNA_ID=CAMNT_0043086333 /DNA_START=77 /DNA_END=2209 /DNA_ORIENTATION=+